MARHAQDREDLLRDAKALKHRVELQIVEGDLSETVFAGFRCDHALSIYFDQDPAYHFNGERQIRRAYWEGQLVKAEYGQLIAMRTNRTKTAVEMLRHEMTPSEQQQFCDELIERLQKLADRLSRQDHITITGVVPEGCDVVDRLQTWLNQFGRVTIADSPRVA